MMNRGSVFSGVLAVALWATLSTAEAKLVRYEINGQRYAYSTNNRQQVREARQRIQAAQQAAAATAQAAAERAANPLVRLFGSPTQTNVAEAQARAQQVLTQLSQAIDATSSVGSSRAEHRRGGAEPRAERSRGRREARADARQKWLSQTPQLLLLDDETAGKAKLPAKHQRRIQEARAEPAATRPDASAERLTATDAKRGEWASLAPHAAASAPSPIPEPVGSRTGQKPALKSVSFDLASGIKTVFMTDGTVHEEPIDSSTASELSAEPAGAGLTSFHDQVRKAPRPQ
jgi:hypothetical protein